MRRDSRPSFVRLLVASVLVILCGLLPATARCDRVLIVTTDRTMDVQQLPNLGDGHEGMYVLTDMVGAGYPFDVVTYGRFAGMDLTPYDVIILNGYSVSTPLSTIAAKCSSAIQQGRKVFINGYYPYCRYDAAGNLVETLCYVTDLFGATVLDPVRYSGRVLVTVPSALEKDPNFNSIGLYYDTIRGFTLSNTPPYVVTTANGRTIGFLTPQGGAIDDTAEYETGLLDYGKIVTYLRSGSGTPIGFANDRIDGQYIASFEVHCDKTWDLTAIAELDRLAADMQAPLINLLVGSRVPGVPASAWNALTNPYMLIGSHSRTHPTNWPAVPDIAYETTGMIADQRLLVPKTINYLDWSGSMNPSTSQIDQCNAAGLVFGTTGGQPRVIYSGYAGSKTFQRMPTNKTWLFNLGNSTSTPYCFGQTVDADNGVVNRGANYVQEVTTSYTNNIRYGMYTYGFFHDYMMDPTLGYATGGVLMRDQIRSALGYLKSEGVKFIPTDQLVLRLRDYVTGSVVRTANLDGTETVTVTRPNARVNEIKIGMKGNRAPSASGASVLSQHYVGEMLYVTLRPEVTSTVTIDWSQEVPVRPVVTAPTGYITSDTAATWYEPLHASAIAEYQYSVGTNPGGAETVPWTSAGTNLSAPILASRLASGRTYYVSVRARYANGQWSAPGSSSPLLADTTPPSTPVVTDDGTVQASQSKLHFSWASWDSETGITENQYAIGTQPGYTDVLGWTSTTKTEVLLDGLHLAPFATYYCSVKVRSGAGVWSAVGTSDGIQVQPSAGSVKALADGAAVDFSNAVVTRVFTGEYYVEGMDRSGGIKISSADPVQEGQVLHITGTLQRSATEVYVANPTVTVTGTGSVKPILISGKFLAGADGSTPGAESGIGLNNVGLLVRIIGKIADIDAVGGYLFIEDGSKVTDLPGGIAGVLVKVADTTAFGKGSIVKVTGICILDNSDPSYLRRAVRIQSDSDVQVLIR